MLENISGFSRTKYHKPHSVGGSIQSHVRLPVPNCFEPNKKSPRFGAAKNKHRFNARTNSTLDSATHNALIAAFASIKNGRKIRKYA